MIHVLAVRGRNIRSAVEEIYSNKKRFDDITNHRIFQTVDKLGAGIIPAPFFPLKLNCIQKFLRNLRFCSFSNPFLPRNLASFLDSYMQKVSPAFISIRAFPMYCVYRNPWCSFCCSKDSFYRFFSFLIDCFIPSYMSDIFCFFYIFSKHDVLSLLHDSCFLYIWISVGHFHIDIHSFYILCIHPCLLYCILESDFLDRCNNHSIHHKHIHIS